MTLRKDVIWIIARTVDSVFRKRHRTARTKLHTERADPFMSSRWGFISAVLRGNSRRACQRAESRRAERLKNQGRLHDWKKQIIELSLHNIPGRGVIFSYKYAKLHEKNDRTVMGFFITEVLLGPMGILQSEFHPKLAGIKMPRASWADSKFCTNHAYKQGPGV